MYNFNEVERNGWTEAEVTVHEAAAEEGKAGSVRRKRGQRFLTLALALGLTAGLGYGAWQYQPGIAESNSMAAQTQTSVEAQNVRSDMELDSGTVMEATATSTVSSIDLSSISASIIDVSDIVAEAMPSVVAVNCVSYTSQIQMGFGRVPGGSGSQSSIVESQSCGTGIILAQSEESLLILTNYHVVEDVDKVSVVFVDENEIEGTVMGYDSDADLAVIEIPLSSIAEETQNQIKIAILGDSDAMEVGQSAIAIGNALGYGQSVTTGVISALNREVAMTDKTMYLIQTDAAINGGNSGGPLLNAKGEVIGINTVKYTSAGVEGMGYAIPISDAKPIIESIIANAGNTEAESAAYLGIYGVDVTEQYQGIYGIPAGIYLYQVESGSPAEAAGMTAGNVITAIDGIRVGSVEELSAILAQHKAGDVMNVTVSSVAQGQYVEGSVSVTLGIREQ